MAIRRSGEENGGMPPTYGGTNRRRRLKTSAQVPGRLHHAGLVAAFALLCAFALVPPAGAHGDDETEEGYLLIQQALGHLAHDTSHTGMDLAMEKVDDALSTEDRDGVDVGEVEKAMSALERGRVDSARDLLQGSIKEAVSHMPPATGEETGTKVIVPAQPGRDGLAARDWSFLGASLTCLFFGLLLAYRFRPADTVGELRRRLDGRP